MSDSEQRDDMGRVIDPDTGIVIAGPGDRPAEVREVQAPADPTAGPVVTTTSDPEPDPTTVVESDPAPRTTTKRR